MSNQVLGCGGEKERCEMCTRDTDCFAKQHSFLDSELMKNWYLPGLRQNIRGGVCVYGNILCATSVCVLKPNPKADLQLDVKYLPHPPRKLRLKEAELRQKSV